MFVARASTSLQSWPNRRRFPLFFFIHFQYWANDSHYNQNFHHHIIISIGLKGACWATNHHNHNNNNNNNNNNNHSSPYTGQDTKLSSQTHCIKSINTPLYHLIIVLWKQWHVQQEEIAGDFEQQQQEIIETTTMSTTTTTTTGRLSVFGLNTGEEQPKQQQHSVNNKQIDIS